MWNRYVYLTQQIPGTDYIEYRQLMLGYVLAFSFVAGGAAIGVLKAIRVSWEVKTSPTRWTLVSMLFFAPVAVLETLIQIERPAAGFADCADLVPGTEPRIKAFGTSAEACLRGRTRLDGPG